MEAMQFGRSLEHILWEILFTNPAHGPVQMIKLDISDGFYRIGINIDNIPKLGVVFPMLPSDKPLIAFPLVLWGGQITLLSSQPLPKQLLISPTPDCLWGGCHRPIPWMS
jgi:hypothetical protein